MSSRTNLGGGNFCNLSQRALIIISEAVSTSRFGLPEDSLQFSSSLESFCHSPNPFRIPTPRPKWKLINPSSLEFFIRCLSSILRSERSFLTASVTIVRDHIIKGMSRLIVDTKETFSPEYSFWKKY